MGGDGVELGKRVIFIIRFLFPLVKDLWDLRKTTSVINRQIPKPFNFWAGTPIPFSSNSIYLPVSCHYCACPALPSEKPTPQTAFYEERNLPVPVILNAMKDLSGVAVTNTTQRK